MNTPTPQDQQQAQPMPVGGNGLKKAKNNQPKILEKVIDKVEDFLTRTVDQDEQEKQASEKPQQIQPQQQAQAKQEPTNPEQAEMQGSLGASDEFILPEGTTIKLPDGKEFVTHTKSKISKLTRQEAGEEGGE